MKSYTRLILFPLLLISFQLFSQESAKIKTEVHSNQQVFITGEDIWLEGNILEGNTSSKSISVRLIDRNGEVKLEKDLQHKQNKFSGFLSVPDNLISDYYFLDCVIKGEKTDNLIQPVIVINPKIPPVLNCQPTATNSENTAYNARISIQTDKNEYLQREPVQVNIGGLNSFTDVSVTAERSDRLSDLIQQNTLGFNKTRFHEATGVKELEGHVIKAKFTVNGNPQIGFTLLASIKSQRANIASAKTDNNGMATFTLPSSFENTQLVITTEKKLPKNSKIEILKPLNTREEPISFPCLQLNEFMREDIEQRILNSSINFRFYGNSSKAYAIPERDTTDFYGKPDQRFLLDEYVRFPNMEEVITEIIPELRIKKEDGNPVLQVLNIPFKTFFSEQALILVDGVPVSNAREILDTDPLRIRSIDLITRRYMIGVTEFPGIVHFKSYKRDLAGLSPEANSLTSAFNGLQESASLQAPILTDSKMPDLRNLLLYEQNIVADETGNALIKFNTSDAQGTYTIKVRAMTPSKQTVLKQLSFKVK
jgi:hypothetical protein